MDAARAVLLGVAALRLARAARARPPLAPAPERRERPRVTVVVPARDEAARIGPCVEALVADGADVVVVDDGSTDATRAVAERAGASVVDAGPLPAGWAGKARALQVGIEAADAPVVAWVDADVRVRPGAIGALVDALDDTDATLLTAGARTRCRTVPEAVLHGAMLASLVVRLGPPGVAPRRPARAMANGQCGVVRRERFLALGGMARVRGALLEDLALARDLAAAGERVAFLDGTGVVDVDGYGSAGRTWRGWGRSLDLAEVTAPADQALDLAVVWSAWALPLPRLLAGRGDVLDVAALALRLGTAVGTRRALAGAGAGWASAVAPLADVPVAARITWGTLRPSRTWRGRTYG